MKKNELTKYQSHKNLLFNENPSSLQMVANDYKRGNLTNTPAETAMHLKLFGNAHKHTAVENNYFKAQESKFTHCIKIKNK